MQPESSRRLLFIVNEFPPSAGGGVQRVASFARFLPEHGWRPHVLTATPVPGRPTDPSLVEAVGDLDVTRLPHRHVAAAIARAGAPLKRLLRRGGGGGQGRAMVSAGSRRPPASTRLARKIAFPDDAVFWSRDVVGEAVSLHDKHGFDAVFASGPPFSTLAAAVRVGERTGLPVVADMRDPWEGNLHAGALSEAQRERARALERSVLGSVAAVTAVSDVIAEEAGRFGAARVNVVPNGFDAAAMPAHQPTDGPLRIVFTGRFSAVNVDPTALLGALAEARVQDESLEEARLDIVGPDAPWVLARAEELGVGDAVRHHGYLPYGETLDLIAASDIGLIVIADVPGATGVYSGKLFDYMGVRIPILLVGPPEGVAAATIHEGRLGTVVRYGDKEAIKSALIELARAKAEGRLRVDPDNAVLARFDRRTHVGVVAEVLESVLS